MSFTGKNHSARRMNLLEHVAGAMDEEDPRCFVRGAAWAAEEILLPARLRAKLTAEVDGLALAGGRRTRLEDVVEQLLLEVFDTAVMVGYALARTWPTSPEAFDRWPHDALRLAGLGGEPEPSDTPQAARKPPPPPPPVTTGTGAPTDGDTLHAFALRTGLVPMNEPEALMYAAMRLFTERYAPEVRRANDAHEVIDAALRRGETVTWRQVAALDEAHVSLRNQTTDLAVLLGFAYGTGVGHQEPERFERAVAYALRHVQSPPDPAPETPAGTLRDVLGAWLAERTGTTPEQALAELERAVPAVAARLAGG